MAELEVIRVHGIHSNKNEVENLKQECARLADFVEKYKKAAENWKEDARVNQATAEEQNRILQACWDAAENKLHVVASNISTNLVYKATQSLRLDHDAQLVLLNQINSIIGEWLVPAGISADQAMQELLQFDSHPMMLKAVGKCYPVAPGSSAQLDGGFRLGDKVSVFSRGIIDGMITSMILEADGEIMFDVKDMNSPTDKIYFDISMGDLQHV